MLVMLVIILMFILYDDKIRDKISDIRAILSRLGDIVTKIDREKIKKELLK